MSHTGGFRYGLEFTIDIEEAKNVWYDECRLSFTIDGEQIKSLQTTIGVLLNTKPRKDIKLEDGPVIWCTKCTRVKRHEYTGMVDAIFQEREPKKLSKKKRVLRDKAQAMSKLIYKCHTCGTDRFYGTYAEKGKV